MTIAEDVAEIFAEAQRIHVAWLGGVASSHLYQLHYGDAAHHFHTFSTKAHLPDKVLQTHAARKAYRAAWFKRKYDKVTPLGRCRECNGELPRKVGRHPRYCGGCKEKRLQGIPQVIRIEP